MSATTSDAVTRGIAQHWASPLWQNILNCHDVPALSAQIDADQAVPVWARLEWQDGTVDIVKTAALGWTTRLVRVEMRDNRWRLGAVWLHKRDVRRRRRTVLDSHGPDASVFRSHE